MALAVKEHEPFDPAGVRLLGPQAVVARPHRQAHPVEQARLAALRVDDGKHLCGGGLGFGSGLFEKRSPEYICRGGRGEA